jgi:Fe-S-cluster-containing dehydrogenase component
MKQYSLVIDHESCWGCKTCEVACKQEHRTTDNVKLISLWEDGPKMVDGKLEFVFKINVCRHCDDPPCAEACPEEAIQKREDGIVVMNYELCDGCQSCIDVCPYDAIDFDEKRNIAQKCNLCHNRVDQGLIPACADNICLAHCIYFGDSKEIDQNLTNRKTATTTETE